MVGSTATAQSLLPDRGARGFSTPHSYLVLPQAKYKIEATEYFKVNLITHIMPPMGGWGVPN